MKRGTGKAQCICPAHVDTKASLTLTDGNDRALIMCHLQVFLHILQILHSIKRNI